MEMTIKEAKTNLESLQKDYQDFHNEVWKDSETYGINAESLKIAIDTMRKYQKIQEIIADWKSDGGAFEMSELYWLRLISEVLEDGKDNC